VEPTEELIEEHAEEPTEEPAASQVSESQNQHLESIPKLDLNTLQPEIAKEKQLVEGNGGDEKTELEVSLSSEAWTDYHALSLK